MNLGFEQEAHAHRDDRARAI
eukprot:COSAG04_NODE_28700_length_274_cov_0.582857_1_plen_20_part_10